MCIETIKENQEIDPHKVATINSPTTLKLQESLERILLVIKL
jgi:hypothetical protein